MTSLRPRLYAHSVLLEEEGHDLGRLLLQEGAVVGVGLQGYLARPEAGTISLTNSFFKNKISLPQYPEDAHNVQQSGDDVGIPEVFGQGGLSGLGIAADAVLDLRGKKKYNTKVNDVLILLHMHNLHS